MARFKCVNGKNVPMTSAEEAQRDAEEQAFTAKASERETAKVLAKRVKEYGSVGEQLDMIYHQGIDAWKAHIASVKQANPKP